MIEKIRLIAQVLIDITIITMYVTFAIIVFAAIAHAIRNMK